MATTQQQQHKKKKQKKKQHQQGVQGKKHLRVKKALSNDSTRGRKRTTAITTANDHGKQ